MARPAVYVACLVTVLPCNWCLSPKQIKNWTVPVLAGGRLYFRGGRAGDLVCLDVSK